MAARRSLTMMWALAVLLGSLAAPALAQTAAPDKSSNVRLLKNFPFKFAADLAYDGRYVYALERHGKGGFKIYDPKKLKQVGEFKCPTYTDLKTLGRGLIALDVTGGCAPGQGVLFLNTKNPKRIRPLGFIATRHHTFRTYPGKKILYLSTNGAMGDLAGGKEFIIDATNPSKPVAKEPYTSMGLGCHDIWIHVKGKRKIAACAAGSETQLWDVSNPFAPVTIARIPTPQTFFNHSAAISDDGNLLIVGDEAHAATECAGGPSGDIWAYDISEPGTPLFKGFFSLNRGTAVSTFWVDPENEWCSAHNYEFIPGTRKLVAGWYAGGMNVIDFSDPAAPKEIAHYMQEETSVWGAYWVDGRVWTTDDDRGVDVLQVKGLKAR